RPEEVGTPVSIGRPVGNTRVLVLDRELRPVPIGVPGELCAGGPGVARGYVGRPDLTAERFVPDPEGGFGERLYRTGDLGRFRANGLIEFLGRRDEQVKLRGFRIELEEIEAVVARQPGVRAAVVTVREDAPGIRRLVGYVVPDREPAPTPQELRSSLQQSLPEYMVPSAFVALQSLPLTGNGKVDRKALPPPPLPEGGGSGYTAPRNELERTIAAIWREVLGLQQVGVHDNLFELGGNSLVVIKLHGRLEQELERKLPIMELFRHTTIDALARALAGDAPQREGGAEQARTRTQTRRESLAQLNEARARRRTRPE
ncbi:MAG TPA: non-ribosomal peptide synthetase, partial [Thermoanaerobaculia bacterium]|nr:non-ribosomal peptide synthetase [Thermoanaerobaculia bacterium]